ncbi:MAG: YdgA family protein [Gammaproteobacteria bacterium]|nr:YdgA family protein [Gammaproteobacteria bacterium]
MKRLALLFLLLLLVAAAAAPYWIGVRAEAEYRTYIERLNSEALIDARVLSFERGWLESQARVALRRSGSPGELQLHDTLRHGPVAVDRWLAGDPDYSVYLARVESRATLGPTGAQLTANTQISLSGDASSRIRMQPLDLDQDGTRLRMAELGGQLAIPAHGRSTQLRLQTDHIELDEKQTDRQIRIRKPSLLLRGDPGNPETGALRFEAEQLQLVEGGRQPLRISGLQFGAESSETEGRLTTVLSLEMTELQAEGGETVGPGKLGLELRDLDAAATRALRDAGGGADLAVLFSELERLLRHSPRVLVSLFLNTPHGETKGEVEVSLDTADPAVLANPLLALTALRATGTLRLPEPALRMAMTEHLSSELRQLENRGELPAMTPQQRQRALNAAMDVRMAEWMRDYRLRRDGENLVAEAVFAAGKLTINGEPVELGKLSPFN